MSTPNIAATSVGQRLRAIRQVRGLTMAEVAPLIGTDVGSVSRIERDLRDPSLEQLRRLAAVYRVAITDILGREATVKRRVA